MIHAYKYKLKPTVKQRKKLSQTFGSVRFIYNWGLNRKKEAWEKNKEKISYVQLARELTALKKDGEHEWLTNCSSVALQQSLRNLDNAYTRFFKEKKGYPKFKSKKNSNDSAKFISGVHFDFNEMRVDIPRVGKVKFLKNQVFDENQVKIGTLTVSRDKCGDYWCTIVVEDNKPQVAKAEICEETAVGIDLGIKDYAILSDGTKYDNPKFLERELNHLAILQQRFAKTQKGSKRHEKMRVKIAKLHRKIRNKRADYLHKMSTDIVQRFDTICLEDLNITDMVQNHNLARAIISVAWNEFNRQLKYKSDWRGKNVVLIDRFDPSSKKCSVCGYVNNELTLNDRKWTCPQCGEHHDRDVNAAINIRNFGLQKNGKQNTNETQNR